MELRLLRYFWTVAEEKNISKAAKVLHITQPTLSRQIKELEEELGTALFSREKKQLRLTEEGYFFKERAIEILSLAESTEREFRNQATKINGGYFSIGCVEADNSDTMAMMLEELLHDYPEVAFNIVSGTSDDISDKLEKGILDLAILLEPTTANDFGKIILPREERWGLLVSKNSFANDFGKIILPREERWGLLVSKNSFLAKKNQIEPVDLEGIPLLCSNRVAIQSMLEDWLNKPLDSLHIIGTYNLIFNIFSLVENRAGSALTIEGATLNRNASKFTFVPLFPEIKTNCVLVWKENRIQSPVVKELIQRFHHAFEA
ncbi:LysR family transcriptional regulator [Carnobacterium maltaromaticum]|uniref:LysR family transcriptional regulator n=1 Tax=Carnobacterium maltaromaticum TaxID=2751 RepID=UPI000C7878A0|nr:LysR family transcriptional regulator [Carnobacterium maltaromaticum]PLS38157.1 LysR family transcriptional regulator [Carnobacterium maltaromaticum]PLS38534.1 LysR family transcriptional regulator [Carnobacterium maltaromaticum]PLS38911.1 LysR family transcriptional regulator [Carnobacterium maltaromaticum]PLS45181.1 LysR family transcriptional regulator [Carnobacterium maltaromaticum]PLS48037.1 LysR family transcriptional regulator [Carnobacterium maltaromaticum]